MQRRTFMTAALATAVLSLAGCAAQTRADTDMPAEAFTPEGARRYLAKCRTAREAIQVYGDPERTMKSNARPSQKGFVWEWVGVRPSFLADKDKRSSCTPTVKRELHVWCGSGGEIVKGESPKVCTFLRAFVYSAMLYACCAIELRNAAISRISSAQTS